MDFLLYIGYQTFTGIHIEKDIVALNKRTIYNYD